MGGRTLRFGAWLLAAVALGAATPAFAGANDRQERQRERIASGVADGSLTRPEARRVVRQQRSIERREQRMRRDDGRLGPRERVRLDHALDRASSRIYYARHDRQSR